jgi:3-hydroxyisobutyrate dehydrogenase-like beta-hydroxyacid dehydrogenase
MTRIAVIGMGAMGSAVAEVLLAASAEVVTFLKGRSAETQRRAEAIGIRSVDLATVVQADIILSIVPPAEALTVAQQISTAMTGSTPSAFFVDCNAISPETMSEIANAFDDNIGRVFDGCIIGGPPKPGKPGPHVYISGGGNNVVDVLLEHGLDARPLDSAIGAASALKMCYAGINKGLIGLGTAMLLAAAESGADKALMAEMRESQSELVAKFAKGVPDMYPKAYRWVAEMKEIADFLGPENPASGIFIGMEGLFQQMAADRAEGGELAATLSDMLKG